MSGGDNTGGDVSVLPRSLSFINGLTERNSEGMITAGGTSLKANEREEV